MNDNDRIFSNGPYKASGNLNTVIGNPDINMNSAVGSNIMEDNNTFLNNVGNNSNISQPIDSNINSNVMNNINSNVMNNVNPNVMNNINVNSSSVINNPVDEFIKKSNSISNVDNTFTNEVNSNYNNYVGDINSTNFNSVNKFSGVSSSNVASDTSSQVRYENVYNSDKNKKQKQSFKIPSEFRTAIFLLLILLIVLSCFEPVYDFFRNLNIFG